MDIVIIGSGNVASVMGRKMISVGHKLVQVAGRNPDTTASLAKQFGCSHTLDFSQIVKTAGVYFIAIPDDALENIGDDLNTGSGLTVHSAGSVSANVLSNVSSRYGVLYPLQSLKSDVEKIPDIPLLVDGNSEETRNDILAFATTISSKVMIADDEYRRKIQLAAVLTGNFSNHLFTMAADYCNKESIDFSLLLPLLQESVERLQYYAPEKMQTGPASRNDQGTIQLHSRLLEEYPEMKKIYDAITASIIEHYHQTANLPS